jgi:NAD+ dependent glucose-6-phosphate dehydrogenase
MNVLVTGANGTVGRNLLDSMGDDPRYDFTLLDREPHPDHETEVADLRDYEAIRPAFEDQDAVIHLAWNPEVGLWTTDVSWTEALAENLEATCNVYRAAVDAGLEKILYMSSVHTISQFEADHRPEVYDDPDLHMEVTDPPRPSSVYGVAKVFGEQLARFCADEYGLRGYVVRLGGPGSPGTPDELAESLHQGSVWISQRDLAQLVECILDDEDVHYDVFFGISDNDNRYLDLSHARETIGYDPQDDAHEVAGEAD